MTKVKDERLVEAAKELTKLMGLKPPIDTSKIDGLPDSLEEAASQLETDDELTDETLQTLRDLDIKTPWDDQEEEEQEEETEEETEEEEGSIDLIKLLDETDRLKELKTIVKTYEEFKPLRSHLTKYGPGKEEELKEDMFDILEQGDEKEKPKKEEKMTKKTEGKKEQKPKKESAKGTGVIATIASLIEDSGKEGISKDEILKNLTKKFPDRSPQSMKNTINVQVPNRISKEKFTVERTEDDKYRKT